MKMSVAMAFYEGGAYVESQLRSILDQTLLPDEIVICDDGSREDMGPRLKAIAADCPVPIRLYRNPGNLGVISNFEKAIGLCRGDYVALCDQDDVWNRDKLELSLAAMEAEEAAYPDRPVLVHTDLTVVDTDLKPLEASFLSSFSLHKSSHGAGARASRLFALRLALQNNVNGCTCLMNRRLLQLALPFPSSVLMHDHWLALLAALHGRLLTLPQATVLYRQHGGNQIGARRHFDIARLAGHVETLRLKLRQLGDARRRA
ncbi:glycosyltransferase family 2 protein [Fulvimarina sp. MAC3]|uniref:glycosyltransferase family 2 protein n=1 Tax=Fulvimarina sp. MAC3 TaxID=3148887 RepID=UPI0031FCC8E5